MASQPWFIKHRPARFTELSFVDDSGFKVLEWLRNAHRGSVLTLSGPTGCGKTALVHAAARALKYRVVDYGLIQDSDVKTVGASGSVEGLRPLILVDEGDLQFPSLPQKFLALDAPVIFTCTSGSKDTEFLKLSRPTGEIILTTVHKILKSENASLDDRIVLKLGEICSYDFRSVINYCQLLSGTPGIRDLGIIDKVAHQSITSMCRSLLTRRMSLAELERIYSEKLMSLCMSSLLENCKEYEMLRAIEAVSELSGLPEKYAFMTIDGLNKLRAEYVYKKPEPVPEGRGHGHEDPLQFLPLYHRNLQDKRGVLHLQEIFSRYELKDLSEIDQDIRDYIEWTHVESKVFKYKYNLGSSSAVRRDMTLREMMNL